MWVCELGSWRDAPWSVRWRPSPGQEETGGDLAAPPPAVAQFGVQVQREARSPQLTLFLYPPRNSRSSNTSITGCRAGGENLGWRTRPPKQWGIRFCWLADLPQLILSLTSSWGCLGVQARIEAQPGHRPLGSAVGAQQGVGPAPSLWQKGAKLSSISYYC